MAVKLKNSSNTEVYEFPSGCELVAEPFAKRLDSEPRAYQHGEVLIGDEKIQSRIISLHGIFDNTKINTTYGATVATNLKEMKQQCYTEDLRLYPDSQYTDEFYFVECLNFETEFLGRTDVVEVNIEFKCTDPFRYYKDETSSDHTVDESPESITESNGGDAEVFGVWTFTCSTGASISSIQITNTTDGGKNCTYTPDSNLTSGDVVELDMSEGTCKLNGSDDISNFTGVWLRLLSGSNSLTVTLTGTAGTNTLNLTYRKRWL